MKPEDRLCLWCRHIDIEENETSEGGTWYPGELACKKKKFEPVIFGTGEFYCFYPTINLAKTCDEFELTAGIAATIKERENQ